MTDAEDDDDSPRARIERLADALHGVGIDEFRTLGEENLANLTKLLFASYMQIVALKGAVWVAAQNADASAEFQRMIKVRAS